MDEKETEVINLIRKFDSGDGTTYDMLRQNLSPIMLAKVDALLISLLKQGEIYERKKNTFKVLE